MTHHRHWLIVASRDHAFRGVEGGFVMANHGKHAPLARMAPDDTVVIYSPREAYPDGARLRAVTVVGEVTGEGPEPSSAIPGGYLRRATLRVVDPPLSLAEVREYVPVSRLRFGVVEIDASDAEAIRALPGRRAGVRF
jgi:hypothetical protein